MMKLHKQTILFRQHNNTDLAKIAIKIKRRLYVFFGIAVHLRLTFKAKNRYILFGIFHYFLRNCAVRFTDPNTQGIIKSVKFIHRCLYFSRSSFATDQHSSAYYGYRPSGILLHVIY